MVDIRRLLAKSEIDMLSELGDAELASMLDGFDRIDLNLRRMQAE